MSQNQNKLVQPQQQQQQWHAHVAHNSASRNVNMFSGNGGGGGSFGGVSGGYAGIRLGGGSQFGGVASRGYDLEHAYNAFGQPPAPSIKMEPIDPDIVTPIVEMDELVIKAEPQDEQVRNNSVDDNYAPYKDLNNHTQLPNSMHNNLNIQIKEELPSTSSHQQKPLNFPRRKVVQTERSDTLPICQRCKQVFLKKHSYTKHVAHSTCEIVENDFKCSICPASFMSNEELLSHEQLHLENKFFCHKSCGKYFATIELCEAHEYMSHDYPAYVCNICTATFPTRENLFAHMPQHKHHQRFDCPVCRLWYQTPQELHEHRLAAPYFCGKFYAGAASSSRSSSFDSNMSQRRQSYNLQDCRMGVMEVSAPINYPTYTPRNTRPFQQDNFPNNNFSAPARNVPAARSPAVKIKQEPDYFEQFQQNFGEYNDDSYNSSTQHSSMYNSNTFNDSGNLNMSSQLNSAVDDSDEAVCCVPQCGTRKSTSPSLQFFTFPKDDKYLHQWLHNLKMPPDPRGIYTHYRICSLHFPKRCINRYSLCYWAVPTFNLGHDDVANLYQNREITNTFTTGEHARCSMPGCASQRGESNLKFYNFPNDAKTLIKWCQNARLPVGATEPRHFCGRHFEQRCFGKFRLKPWAVPTLHLGTPYGKIHDNPNIFYLEEKKCCLNHCKRTRSSDFNLSLYRFPRDETLLQRWCYNLRLDPSIYRGKNHKICSAHFIKEALGLRKLSPGAVPTLNLGHNDLFDIYTNELYTPPPPPPPAAVPAQRNYSFHESSMNSMDFSTPSLSASPINFGTNMSNSSSTLNTYDTIDQCAVPSCKRNRHTDSITLHTIPRRPEQMRKWCHNLKMDPARLHKGVRICSMHFEPYCIGGCMRPFAVPTLNLGHDDQNIYRNPDVIKKLNIRETCCVAVCKRNRDRDHANLHRFPSNPEQMRKWCENLQKPVPDGTRLFNDAICEMHFEDRCLRNKRLEKWSLPTLNLGHDDIAHQLPTEEEVAEFWAKPLPPNTGDEEGYCCVESCKRNPAVDDIKLYRVPEDPEVLSKWAHNLSIDATELATLRICNLHFESHCIGKRLHSWALPTLNLGQQAGENLYENPEVPMLYEKFKYGKMGGVHAPPKPWVPRCCLPHCRKTRAENVQLYRFPGTSRSVLAKWCHNVQQPIVGSTQRRICSSHFEPWVLTKKCPMFGSVPTLDLNVRPGAKIYQNPPKLQVTNMRSQRICIIADCKKGYDDGVQLFKFPTHKGLLRKWCHNTQQKASEALRGQYRVCSAHFEPHSFGAKRLMAGAIPTLNLGEVEDIFANEAQTFAELQCVINNCPSVQQMDQVRLFKFPCEDEDLLWKWCNNLKMNPVDCQGVRICNRHFEDFCLGAKTLYKWAIPTLELGHDDSEIELVDNPKPADRVCEVTLRKCVVPTCGKTRKYDEVQLNSFPKNADLFRRWKHNLKLDYLVLADRDKYKICNAHFEKICLGQHRLHYGAVPTLNLGHENTDDLIPVNPDELRSTLFGKLYIYNKRSDVSMIKEEGKTEHDDEEDEDADDKDDNDISGGIRKCAHPKCNNAKVLLREPYELPKHAALLKIWCEFMEVTEEDIADEKLCGFHFIAIYEGTLAACKALIDGGGEDAAAVKTELESIEQTYERCQNSVLICSSQCSVNGCSTNLLSSHRLFQFPYNHDLIKKWCFNTGIEFEEERRSLYKVCALHFEPQCLTERQRLRNWGVIPTLALSHKTPEAIYKNPDLKALDRHALGPIENKCCVPDCVVSQSAATFIRYFPFPADEDMAKKWAHNLKLEAENTRVLKICEQHFEPECVGRVRLFNWAIPTLKLGHMDRDIYKCLQPSEKAAVDVVDVPHVKMKKGLDLIKCCVPTCRRSRLQHGVRLFQFPTGPVMLKKWCNNIRMPVRRMELNVRVCERHFNKRCIDGKHLRQWSVPTLHLGHADVPYDNPKNVPGLFLPICCVPHCRKRRTLDNNLRTFRFPRDGELLRKWCENLGMEFKAHKGRICTEHFEADVMGNRKLRTGAVPTLNLWHTETPKYNNDSLLMMVHSKACDISYPLKMEEDEELEEDEDFLTPIVELDADDDDADGRQQNYNEIDDDSVPAELVTPTYEGTDKVINNSDPICRLKHCLKKKTGEQHLTTFGFPKDPVVLRKWCDNLKLRPEEAVGRVCIEHFELRMLHHARRLKPGTVPTLNLGHKEPLKHVNVKDDEEALENPPEDEEEAQMIDVEEDDYENYENYENDENVENDSDNELESSLLAANHLEIVNSDSNGSLHDQQAVFRLCCLKHCRRRKKLNINFPEPTIEFPQDARLRKEWCEILKLPYDDSTPRSLCLKHFEPQAIANLRANLHAVPTLQLEENAFDDLSCIVPSCGCTEHEDGVKLFQFPRNFEKLRKWCHNLQLEIRNCYSYYICNMHFEPHCFNDHGTLVTTAVPTLLLGPKTPGLEIYDCAISAASMMHCSVTGCGKVREIDGVRMNSFPKNAMLYKKWVHNLKLQPVHKAFSGYKVCDDHFEEQCKGGQRLKPGAIPTLRLGHTDKRIYALKSATGMYVETTEKTVIKAQVSPVAQVAAQVTKTVAQFTKTTPNLHCLVPGCKLQEHYKLELHRLPQDAGLAEMWLESLTTVHQQVATAQSRVCSLHFVKAFCATENLDDTAREQIDQEEHKGLQRVYTHLISRSRVQKLQCCVPGCRSIYDHDTRLYLFPTNSESFEMWCHNVDTPIDRNRLYLYKVCHLHFEQHCFGQTRLKNWAVPTLRLHKEKIFLNPQTAKQDKCCVKNCDRNNAHAQPRSTRFWHLPKHDKELRAKWCSNLCLDEANDNLDELRVCGQHFEPYCYDNRELQPWALPTLCLNHANAADIHQNPAEEKKARTCCIGSCQQTRDDDAGIRLYEFPQDNPELLAKWLHNARLTVEESRGASICTLHFKRQLMGKHKLRRGAVPTLDLGHTGDDIYAAPRVKRAARKEKCAVAHCGRLKRLHSVQLYNFPEEASLLQKWQHNLQMNQTDGKICSAHFEPQCIKAQKLKVWAVPTLQLATDMQDIAQNPSKEEAHKLECLSTKIKKCCVPTCQQTSVDGQLFSFPKIDWLLQKWCENLQLPLGDTARRRICALHFEPQAMGRLKPLPWALPTLALGHSAKIHENSKQLLTYHPEEHASGEIKYVRGNCCSIVSCLNARKDGVHLFKYPIKRAMLDKWAENCKHYPYQAARYGFLICSEHFEAKCFRSAKKLYPGSVPTLKLGHNDPNIHQSVIREASVVSSVQKLGEEQHCSVPNCGRAKLRDNVKMYKFPDNAEMVAKWCHNLKLPAECVQNLWVCSVHFESRCMNNSKWRLFIRAIPTLHLGHSDPDVIPNPASFDRPKAELQCSVPGCGKVKYVDNVLISGFPKVRSLFLKWAHNLKMPPSNEVWHKYKVCSAHFEPDCYEHDRLLHGAIPTLNLGHDDDELKLFNAGKELHHHRKRRSLPFPKPADSKCCFADCSEIEQGRTRKGYELPELAALRAQWIASLGVEDAEELQLCPLHYKITYDKNLDFQTKIAENATEEEAAQIKVITQTYNAAMAYARVVRCACAVPGCASNFWDEGIKLYALPYLQTELCEKWLWNIGTTVDDTKLQYTKVCSLHFEPDCTLESRRLKHWAIPTLNLPTPPEGKTLHPNPDMEQRVRRHNFNESCCMPGCPHAASAVKKEASVRLYAFPKAGQLLKQWLHNTQIDRREALHSRICNLHFEARCITPTGELVDWAMPTRKLDSEVQDIYQLPDAAQSDKSDDDAEHDEENDELPLYNLKKKLKLETPQPDSLPKNNKPKLAAGMPEYDELEAVSMSSAKEELEAYASAAVREEYEAQSTSSYGTLLPVKSEPLDLEDDSYASYQDNDYLHSPSDSGVPKMPLQVPLSRQTSRHCRVVGCWGHADKKGITLHKFPIPEDMFAKWVHNTQIIVDKTCRWKYRICSRHFEQECFGGIRLMVGTVPTLNLGPNKPKTIYYNSFNRGIEPKKEKPALNARQFMHYEPVEPLYAPKVEKPAVETEDESATPRDSSRYCRIEGCNGNAYADGTTMHKFPKNPAQFKKWVYNTGVQVDPHYYWKYRICSRHFDKRYFRGVRLIPGTLPTLHLGANKNAKIYQNTSNIDEMDDSDDSGDLRDEDDVEPLPMDDEESCNAIVESARCSIDTCGRERGQDGVYLHKLPFNLEQQRKWIYNCSLESYAENGLLPNARICSAHFTEQCFVNGAQQQLHNGAVPTLALGYGNKNIYQSNLANLEARPSPGANANGNGNGSFAEEDSNDDVMWEASCCVPTCGSSRMMDESLRFFKFPENKRLLAAWLQRLKIDYNAGRSWEYNICELHFTSGDFNGNKLREGAMPSTQLDGDDELFTLPAATPFKPLSHSLSQPLSQPLPQSGNVRYNEIRSGYHKCCLVHCQKVGSRHFVHIFKFPKSDAQKAKWSYNLRIKFDPSRPWKYLICSDHFEEQCILRKLKKTQLYKWAVPTLNLGNNVPTNLYTNENTRAQHEGQLQCEPLGFGDELDTTEQNDSNDFNEDFSADQFLSVDLRDDDDVAGAGKAAETGPQNKNVPDYAAEDSPLRYLNLMHVNEDSSCLPGTREAAESASSAYQIPASKLRRCCLPHCQRQRSEQVKLFRVPMDSDLLRKWEHNLKTRFEEKWRNSKLICSSHFPPHLVGVKRLMKDAIPTLNLGHDDTNIYENMARDGDFSELNENDNTNDSFNLDDYTETCEVPGCGSARNIYNEGIVQLFNFPESEKFIAIWEDRLKLRGEPTARVCNEHFEKHFITNNKLAEDAVPTLNLPPLGPNYCHVPGCVRTSKQLNVFLFAFPQNENFLKIWMDQTQIAYERERHEEIRVCDAHFESNCIRNNQLCLTAIPTLNLPAKTAVAAAPDDTSATKCSVAHCQSTSQTPGVKLFSKFPDDFELFTKWCFNLKVDPRKYQEGSYHVCSKHFEPHCIGGHSLREWAIPTLSLGHVSAQVHKVERPSEAETKCCLPHCGRKRSKDNVMFFNFPKGDAYKLWCNIFQIDEGLYRNFDKKICSAHFAPNCFVGSMLKPGAKPSLNLGPPATIAPVRPQASVSHHAHSSTRFMVNYNNVKCAVKTCNQRTPPLYRFPQNRNLCVKWCHNVKMEYHRRYLGNSEFQLCPRHFEPQCLNNGRLHPEALPTLHLGHNDDNIFQNIRPVVATTKRNTPSYDDNSSLQTSVSNSNTLNMDVDDDDEVAYQTEFRGKQRLAQSTFIASTNAAIGTAAFIDLIDDDDDDVEDNLGTHKDNSADNDDDQLLEY